MLAFLKLNVHVMSYVLIRKKECTDRLSARKNLFMCRFFVYAVHISTFALLFLSLVDDAWMFSSSSSSEDEGTDSRILGMYILYHVKHKYFCLNLNSRTFFRLLQLILINFCNYPVDVFLISLTDIPLTVMVFLSTGTKRKVGRPSVVDCHPEIIEIVNDFITQHSSSAHDRRRDDAQYSHGVTLSAIRSRVLREIPSLKEISVHTIHCLLLPPNKNRKASKHYKSLIDAKQPPKRNDLTCKTHPDFHYTSTQVNIVGELAEMFSDETIAISADDKNKVNVGTLAVSRHFSINNIFATDDQRNYPDHDFPYANAKLVPARYLFLKSRKWRSRSHFSP